MPKVASACAAARRRRTKTTRRSSRSSRRSSRMPRTRAASRAGEARVGIGTPGSLSRATGLLRGSNSVCLNGMPVKRDLEHALARADRAGERCELLRAVGSDRRRGARRRCRVRRDPRHRRGRRHRRPRPRAGRPQCDRRRVGTQSAAVAERRRASRRAVLLRAARAASKRGCRARAWRATTDAAACPGDCVVDAGRSSPRAAQHDAGVRSDARPLRGAPRAGACARDQHRRSGRHRAGRRVVERRALVQVGAAAMDALDIQRSRRYACSCAMRTAIRAACAAPRGSPLTPSIPFEDMSYSGCPTAPDSLRRAMPYLRSVASWHEDRRKRMSNSLKTAMGVVGTRRRNPGGGAGDVLFAGRISAVSRSLPTARFATWIASGFNDRAASAVVRRRQLAGLRGRAFRRALRRPAARRIRVARRTWG